MDKFFCPRHLFNNQSHFLSIQLLKLIFCNILNIIYLMSLFLSHLMCLLHLECFSRENLLNYIDDYHIQDLIFWMTFFSINHNQSLWTDRNNFIYKSLNLFIEHKRNSLNCILSFFHFYQTRNEISCALQSPRKVVTQPQNNNRCGVKTQMMSSNRL